MDRTTHWESVYRTKQDREVSWFQEVPQPSLDLIEACALERTAALLDVGAGSSALVDHLVDLGFRDVTALDVSAAALERARLRLGNRAEAVHWVVSDVTRFGPERSYDLWHDRATFHFLTDADDRRAYRSVAEEAVAPGGWVVIACFAPHGPTKCSGLDVQRHDGRSLGRELGPCFELVEERVHDHTTPGGAVQAFTYARLRRVD